MNARSPNSETLAASCARNRFAFRISVFGFLALLTASCEKYQPLPLDDHVLPAPSNEVLQSRINTLRNPLLKPLELHPEQGLTPDEAAVIAVVLNPSLRAQRDAHQISQAVLLQAGILPNPQLSYSYDWNTGGTFPGAVNAYGLGLNYDVTALISHTAKVKSAEWSASAADLNIAWQEWQTAQAAKAAVFDLLSLQQQWKLADEVDERLAENLKVIRNAADVGLKTAVDLAAAESASRDAHAIVLQTARDMERQRLNLNRAMGVLPNVRIELNKNTALATAIFPPDVEELYDRVKDDRLDLVALKHGYESQEQSLVAACLDQFPRINLGFTRNRDNTNVRSFGLGVSIDLPIFDRNQGTIAAEKANRQKLFDEYTARIFDARADIAQAVADIRAINTQIEDAQAALPNLKKLVEVYKTAVDHGNADVLSYYLAWNNLTQKNLDVLKLQQQLEQNRIALELASGRYLADDAITPASQPSILSGGAAEVEGSSWNVMEARSR